MLSDRVCFRAPFGARGYGGIHCALDLGINFFDTADSYGQGDSELRLGRALKGRRDKIVIATKAGFCFSRRHAAAEAKARRQVRGAVSSGRWRGGAKGALVHECQTFSPAYVRAALDASLQRLQMDVVDLFLLHNPPPDALVDPELVATLDGLVKAGKARHWGVSCRQAVDALSVAVNGPAKLLQVRVSFTNRMPASGCCRRSGRLGPASSRARYSVRARRRTCRRP